MVRRDRKGWYRLRLSKWVVEKVGDTGELMLNCVFVVEDEIGRMNGSVWRHGVTISKKRIFAHWRISGCVAVLEVRCGVLA